MSLSRRSFTQEDQARFAEFSGDYNPMHLDNLAARRTQAGQIVVHGMHQVLWAFDDLAPTLQNQRVTRVHARFPQFLFLNELAELTQLEQSGSLLRLSIGAAGTATVNLVLTLAPGRPEQDTPESVQGCVNADVSVCREHTDLLRLNSVAGTVRSAGGARDALALFPRACSLVGATRIAAIAGLSRLVGMVVPGLHSIFSAIHLTMTDDCRSEEIAYEVRRVDRRFSFLQQHVRGSGIEGVVEAFLRNPPAKQDSVIQISDLVCAGEFSGRRALVIGGSRGLGEFVAKAIAAGGGEVIATYSVGKEDCERVAAAIRAAGGVCSVMRYDALRSPQGQLPADGLDVTSMYYFATGRIYARPGALYDTLRFDEFRRIYIDGFYALCEALRSANRPLSVLYPSSVFVEERPIEMTVYAMAKAAGEILCQDMQRLWPELHILAERLPRQKTDQTGSIMSAEAFPSTAEVMLPLIRRMEHKLTCGGQVSRDSVGLDAVFHEG